MSITSFFRDLKQELYSLPRESPVEAVGSALMIPGLSIGVLSRMVTHLDASKAFYAVEPFYTISNIALYVGTVGATIYAAGIFLKLRKKMREVSKE